MAFRVVKGRTKVQSLPFTASVALAKGTLVEWTSGYLAAADDNDIDVAGILDEPITAADADYATTGKMKRVIVPTERHVVYEADTADTYVAATHQGVECGIVDSANLDLDDTTNDIFRPIASPATGKVLGYLRVNGSY